jgi:hypothetical protein
MWKRLLIVVLILIGLLVLIGAFLPKRFSASGEISIAADRTRVHALVGDLSQWDRWGPWKDGDPTLVVTLGEQTSGVGARQSWKGDTGDGELTFTQCDPERGIAYDLLFIDGERRSPAKSWLSYTPQEGATKVVWGLEGELDVPIVGGWMTVLMRPALDGMIQQGLTKLKQVAESGS